MVTATNELIRRRKLRPQLADRAVLRRMEQRRREVRERLQHERAAQQVRPRQDQPRHVAHELVEHQDVQIHRARRPLRRVARPAAVRFDALQLLFHLPGSVGGAEPDDQIDEVFAGEADRMIAVRG